MLNNILMRGTIKKGFRIYINEKTVSKKARKFELISKRKYADFYSC